MWKFLVISTLVIISTLFLSASSVFKTKPINQQLVVNQHNSIRKELKIEPLMFSQECADFAQQWAEKLAKKNHGLSHSKKNKYGENIYWCSDISNETEMINAWTEEKEFFNTKRRNHTKRNGHYTQMIWENTKYVGTGMAIAKDGSQYWVCTYYPPGNWIGEKAYHSKLFKRPK